MAKEKNIYEGKELGALFVRPELLMQPNIVKPLHSVAPRNIMGQWWWDRQRQRCYAKNNFHCYSCGIHKSEAPFRQWLEAHESYKVDLENCRYTLDELVGLCHACHNFIHSGRMKALVDQGKSSMARMQVILKWGHDLLEFNGLDKSKAWWTQDGILQQFFPEHIGTWDKWHLILDGEKFYSPFKDYAAWARNYGHSETKLDPVDYTLLDVEDE